MLDELYTGNSLFHLTSPVLVQWMLDETASVEYPFEGHRDLLMLVSCNVSWFVVLWLFLPDVERET